MPLFDAAKAREAAARSAQVRRERAEARRQARTMPPPAEPAEPGEPDNYLLSRLARVRKQLDNLDAMILAERDPQRLDRLAAATSRLSEQERLLAGRPAPGSYRPSAPRRRPAGTVALVPE